MHIPGCMDTHRKPANSFRELDQNASAILETLASAIEQMQGLESKRADHELRNLASKMEDVQDSLHTFSKKVGECGEKQKNNELQSITFHLRELHETVKAGINEKNPEVEV